KTGEQVRFLNFPYCESRNLINRKENEMIKHHITKYSDNKGNRKAVSWTQINIFGKCFCLNKREINI
ncbi:MAG: hypothetical protein L0G01_11165, partial [Lactococcus lactis]|nr:hypothetical protein [Lactococcus lactis]